MQTHFHNQHNIGAPNNNNTASEKNSDISIYIHWPYCEKKCPYCDFNSHVASTMIDLEEYCSLYISALNHYYPILRNKNIVSIFFGGGTPSLAPISLVRNIIHYLKTHSNLAPNAEITLEANPNSTEMNKMRLFKSAGINRVSLGVQSLNESTLKFLGRTHTKACAIKALETVSDIYDSYSFDLIYALPNQDVNSWSEELHEALQFAKQHISLYQLTIENNTAFGNLYKRGILKPLNEGHAADMYEETQIIMNNYNMPAYEISNHALPGHESVHNMRYWQYKDFIGIGPGAHGRIISNDQDKSCLDTSQRINNMKKNAIATVDERLPHKWAERVKGKGHGLDSISVLDEKMLQEEKILMGMRVKHGLPISILPQSAHKQIPKLLDLNLIKIHNDRIRATTKGMMLLNQVIFLLLDE